MDRRENKKFIAAHLSAGEIIDELLGFMLTFVCSITFGQALH